MKKKLTLIYLLPFFSLTVSFAQKNLEIKENTSSMSVFIDKDTIVYNAGGKQAGLTIQCSTELILNFTSNVDKMVDVYNVDVKGGIRYYYLRFILGVYRGQDYRSRKLEVLAQGYYPLKFDVNLQSGESKSYEIFDPIARLSSGCFNQFYNEGVDLFRKALYQEAQVKYRLSMECNDVPPDVNMNEKIAIIDSILSFRKKGDSCFIASKYKEASEYYQKIISYNGDDLYASSRVKYTDFCNNNFYKAENYFSKGIYKEAKPLYESVIDQSCPNSIAAHARLKEIKDKTQNAQAVLYEYAHDTPIGISAGKYRKGSAAYISLRLNSNLFETIRNNYEKADRPELDISAGATIKVYNPIWIFFGPGYTGVGEWFYTNSSTNSDSSNSDSSKNNDPVFTVYSAISPEIGLLGKIGPVVLRYTFQYRFALEMGNTVNNDKLSIQDYIGKIRHVIGVGFCF